MIRYPIIQYETIGRKGETRKSISIKLRQRGRRKTEHVSQYLCNACRIGQPTELEKSKPNRVELHIKKLFDRAHWEGSFYRGIKPTYLYRARTWWRDIGIKSTYIVRELRNWQIVNLSWGKIGKLLI